MALINLRNALMSGKRLPYDAEIEFLESTGTQWIDTGAPLNLQHSIRCVFHEIDTSTYYPGVVSGRGSPVHLHTYTILSPRFDYWNGSDVSPSANVLSLTRGVYTDFKTEVSTSDNRLYRYVNGAKSYTSLQSGFTPNNIWLFRDHANTDLFVGRLYCYQELEGSLLVRDFIPVRKGTVGYLYDRVSGKLFGNAGTGDFQYGQDVVPMTWQDGLQYNNVGTPVESATSSIGLDYIPITAGHSFTWRLGYGSSASADLIIYNANKERIDYWVARDRTVTISGAAAYMRVSALTSYKEQATVYDETAQKYVFANGRIPAE